MSSSLEDPLLEGRTARSAPSRTITRDEPSIAVPGCRAVVYDFQISAPRVRITIPAASEWNSEPHWHRRRSACERLLFLRGGQGILTRSANAHITDTTYLGFDHPMYAPEEIHIAPSERIFWRRYSDRQRERGQDLEVLVTAENAEEATQFHRTVASVMLDAEVYPRLSTTPCWVRFLFALLGCLPMLQRWLAQKLLRLQLNVIYHANDFWIVHILISIRWLWFWRIWDMPPKWVPLWEWRMSEKLSMKLMGFYAFIGRTIFRMQAEYDEYTPSTFAGEMKPLEY